MFWLTSIGFECPVSAASRFCTPLLWFMWCPVCSCTVFDVIVLCVPVVIWMAAHWRWWAVLLCSSLTPSTPPTYSHDANSGTSSFSVRLHYPPCFIAGRQHLGPMLYFTHPQGLVMIQMTLIRHQRVYAWPYAACVCPCTLQFFATAQTCPHGHYAPRAPTAKLRSGL